MDYYIPSELMYISILFLSVINAKSIFQLWGHQDIVALR